MAPLQVPPSPTSARPIFAQDIFDFNTPSLQFPPSPTSAQPTFHQSAFNFNSSDHNQYTSGQMQVFQTSYGQQPGEDSINYEWHFQDSFLPAHAQAELALDTDQLLAPATADYQMPTFDDHFFTPQHYTSMPPQITEQWPFQMSTFDARFFTMQNNTSMPLPMIERTSPQMPAFHDQFFTPQNHTSMIPSSPERSSATMASGSGPTSTSMAVTYGAESNSWLGVRPDLSIGLTSSPANRATDSAPLPVSWPRVENHVSQGESTLASPPATSTHKKRSYRSAKGSKRYPRHNRMTDDYSAESFPELSPQELLDGGNGEMCIASHDIDGPVILKVAAVFTNEEIHSHISRLQKREGFVAKGYNCITKRITNSLEHWAKQTGCSCTAETNKFMSNWRERRMSNLKALGKAGNAVSFKNRPVMSANAMARQRK